jgi:hypothetical protein
MVRELNLCFYHDGKLPLLLAKSMPRVSSSRKGRKGLLKDNADDLRSARGQRSVRFGIAHAKGGKALLRSVSAGSLSFAGFADSGPVVAGHAYAWGGHVSVTRLCC